MIVERVAEAVVPWREPQSVKGLSVTTLEFFPIKIVPLSMSFELDLLQPVCGWTVGDQIPQPIRW